MALSQNSDRPAVLITGSSTGIGEACALDLDQRGFRVFAGVRSEADGQNLCQKASPYLTPVILDVTQLPTIEAAAKLIAAATGPAGLAGLVNNAGIVVVGPLELIPLEEIRKQFEVNVIGQIAVLQAMLPLLRLARGRVVNMGSMNGFLAPPYFGPYSASKFALEALTDCLRGELRQWGIAVSIVEPGSVSTPIWQKSQAASDRLAGGVSPESYALYEQDLAAIRAAAARLAAGAMPVKRVVEAVRHALTARRPKTRYPVGAEVRMARIGAKLLPNRFLDRIVRRALKLL